jgi:hypothetical protein
MQESVGKLDFVVGELVGLGKMGISCYPFIQTV